MLWRDHNQVKTFALNNSNNVDHCYFLTNLTQYIFTDAHTHTCIHSEILWSLLICSVISLVLRSVNVFLH